MLMFSAAYCDQISQVLFAKHSSRLLYKNNWLLLSYSKVITLNGLHRGCKILRVLRFVGRKINKHN
jgi:hypothetical protein